jgi:23S rRNA pseudouridine2605 synthase
MGKVRIQKLLSESGVASRRGVEQMILDGRITVNGELVLTVPCFVDPDEDDIRVDGQPTRKRAARNVYVLLNKPKGVVCTQRDPKGRPRATDLIPRVADRVYCVGRLDVDGVGLILLTNDGELTQYLTHPRYGVAKTYLVEIDGQLDPPGMSALRRGSWMEGHRTQGAAVRVVSKNPVRSVLEVRVTEGPNREIWRIFARLGRKVRRIKRTAIGPITDRGLKIGHYRFLRPEEVEALRTSGGHLKAES